VRFDIQLANHFIKQPKPRSDAAFIHTWSSLSNLSHPISQTFLFGKRNKKTTPTKNTLSTRFCPVIFLIRQRQKPCRNHKRSRSSSSVWGISAGQPWPRECSSLWRGRSRIGVSWTGLIRAERVWIFSSSRIFNFLLSRRGRKRDRM